ncbi:hypothetical protein H6G97_46770 [Nostoc flagelliforme FACHB-838]|uniref:Uncharacterized protein n=1 Tax=Nostoc flagelliforme FACHB-838 TaxID=2692904 RepID=A0ABR8E4K7_9NOSO|nr:hypothetical protein [Nostoc flagelliforme]MBD2536393.1 hypothetical protein [Nostoc flagelliforme FACHB-838]
MDLIALTNERFLGDFYDFISDYDGGWMIKLFYLIKVNVALWFGWESTSIRNSQFVSSVGLKLTTHLRPLFFWDQWWI